MSDSLIVQRGDGVTRLVLSREKVGNSLSLDLVCALQQHVDCCYSDGTRLLVLEAQGRHFCTGFDLSDLDSETDDTLLARFVRIELLLQAIHRAPFTTAALGHGLVMGAGADLFAACEVRWLTGPASFRFPGAAFGLVLGTGRLARLIGAALARDWVGSGRKVESKEALASGFATAQIEPESLADALEALAIRARRLEPTTQGQVYEASGGDPGLYAKDLYALIRSAARPDLKKRIQEYRAAGKTN
ncbi:MAG TPA: enoyl-CoA hydratase/isomerase family protein [Eoetvoesiella sp.]